MQKPEKQYIDKSQENITMEKRAFLKRVFSSLYGMYDWTQEWIHAFYPTYSKDQTGKAEHTAIYNV